MEDVGRKGNQRRSSGVGIGKQDLESKNSRGIGAFQRKRRSARANKTVTIFVKTYHDERKAPLTKATDRQESN